MSGCRRSSRSQHHHQCTESVGEGVANERPGLTASWCSHSHNRMRVNRVITLPKAYTCDWRTPDPVHRRRLLGKLGTGFVAWTAGCVAPTGTGDTTANDTNTTDTTANDTNTTDTTATDTNDTETSTEQTAHPHPIQIVCRSLDAASRTVTFELSTEAERIGTTTIQLGPQDSTTVDLHLQAGSLRAVRLRDRRPNDHTTVRDRRLRPASRVEPRCGARRVGRYGGTPGVTTSADRRPR